VGVHEVVGVGENRRHLVGAGGTVHTRKTGVGGDNSGGGSVGEGGQGGVGEPSKPANSGGKRHRKH